MADIDALRLLADAQDVVRYLKPLPKAQEMILKHLPTGHLFESFLDCVERLAAHIRPISKERPEAEQSEPATLIGVPENRRMDFIEWVYALELTLRDILLDRYGTRFYFATDATTEERKIVIEHRDLEPCSDPQAGRPKKHPAKIRLTPADIDRFGRYVDELALLVNDRNMEPSKYRTPQQWRDLRKTAGLSASERTWGDLRKKHPADIHGEPGNESKSCRITRSLADSWGLSLPEFTP